MKVLQLIQKAQLRGAEIFACRLSDHLVKMGIEVVMVTLFEESHPLPFGGRLVHMGRNPKRRFYDVAGWKKLNAIIREERPDIIQCNAADTLKYAVFSKILFRWKVPVIYRNASTISRYLHSGIAKRFNSLLFRQVSHIISVSHFTAKDFVELFPFTKDKISVIPVGVDNIELPDDNKPGNNNPVIIHIGGFSFEKNHEGIIRIFKDILSQDNTAKLYLVGDGKLHNKIKELAHKSTLNGNIVFYGYQSNPLKYLTKADVLILPSIIEGLPSVILEAFYCKVPVVAYNVGGIPELIKHNVTGYLVDKNDEQSFSNAILDCLQKNDKKEMIINNAYHLVRDKYMNEQLAGEFAKVYDEVRRENTLG